MKIYFQKLLTFASKASIIELRRNKKVERNVLNEIEAGYAQFTKKQKKLADFMRENIHSIPFLSIVELGEKTEVSPEERIGSGPPGCGSHAGAEELDHVRRGGGHPGGDD